MELLRAHFEKEVGPFPLRKSSQLYESWVQQAGGVIKGARVQRQPSSDGAGAAANGEEEAAEGGKASGALLAEADDDKVVVPL